jgi:DNA-binding transcriptional LysR family regulator
MRAPVQADLIQRKLFTVHYHVYAAPQYLARMGKPDNLEDLSKHTIIVYGETASPEIRDVNWLQDSARRLAPSEYGAVLRINNMTGILHTTEAGIGIAALPDYVAAQRPTLVRILPDVEGPSFDVHLVYCDALRQSKRVGAFRDFLVRAARDWKY